MGQTFEGFLRFVFLVFWKDLSSETQMILIGCGGVILAISFAVVVFRAIGVWLNKHHGALSVWHETLVTRIRRISGFRANLSVPLRLALLLPIALLLMAAISAWPYNFYIVLRWVVCGTAVYAITVIDRMRFIAWALVLGFVAFIFNPISRLHLDRDTWAAINLIAAATLLILVITSQSIQSTSGTGSLTTSDREI